MLNTQDFLKGIFLKGQQGTETNMDKKWFFRDSLQFKFTLAFLLLLTTVTLLIIGVMQAPLREQLEQETYKLVEQSGNEQVALLSQRLKLAATLTQSMARLAETLPKGIELYRKTIPNVLDLRGYQGLVAGGGIWPEPYTFSPDLKQRSFFWGRNEDGKLIYYDDYNDPGGAGYHNEEWYVPARYLDNDRCYWSRSYVDPYSRQPMVTCTVAYYKQGQYSGAATVDLMLEGLDQFFAEHTHSTGGYGFAVDQNNTFISFPDRNLILNKKTGDEEVSEFKSSDNLASDVEEFEQIASILHSINMDLIKQVEGAKTKNEQLVKYLHTNSYQISEEQAKLIKVAMVDPKGNAPGQSSLLKRFSQGDDILLNEPVTVSIFLVPGTYWKVVLVTPISKDFAIIKRILRDSLFYILFPIITLMLLAFVYFRRDYIQPLQKIAMRLKEEMANPGQQYNKLDESREDEIGQVAYWFNRRTEELDSTMLKLSTLNQELEHQATHDSLTELPNRREFERRLDAVLQRDDRGKNSPALIYLDVDQFKVVNDTCGHIAGDQLLNQIGVSLNSELRQRDTLARLGGDEFGLILNSINVEYLHRFTERLRSVLEDIQFTWEGKAFHVSGSLGVVVLDETIQDMNTALRHADTACHAAKDSGRNRVHFYYDDDDLLTSREGEMQWLPRLREALEKNQFTLLFQEIVPVESNNLIKGMEVLVRMKDTDGRLIPPGAFLPAAERYNMANEIDRWVIKHSLLTLKRFKNHFKEFDFITINLSALSFSDEKLPEYISALIQANSVPAEKLCFEITETATISNLSKARVLINQIAELGCQFALDDFGAGMSSYGYLRELPVEYVKIDGHFVLNMTSDPVHHAFVKSITEISHSMGLKVIAEFVENDEILQALREIQVDFAQGFGLDVPNDRELDLSVVIDGGLPN